MTIICPSCKAENKDEAIFCEECGWNLTEDYNEQVAAQPDNVEEVWIGNTLDALKQFFTRPFDTRVLFTGLNNPGPLYLILFGMLALLIRSAVLIGKTEYIYSNGTPFSKEILFYQVAVEVALIPLGWYVASFLLGFLVRFTSPANSVLHTNSTEIMRKLYGYRVFIAGVVDLLRIAVILPEHKQIYIIDDITGKVITVVATFSTTYFYTTASIILVGYLFTAYYFYQVMKKSLKVNDIAAWLTVLFFVLYGFYRSFF